MNKLQERIALKRIGEVSYNNCGEKMTIIKYNDCDNVTVQFENDFCVSNIQYGNFKRGAVRGNIEVKHKPLLSDRIGEISYSNIGNEKMIIIEYIRADKVVIKFESGYITTKTYKAFTKGEVRNPYYRSLYNIGFIGEGKYKVHENNKITRRYKIWWHMMRRCYDIESYEKKHSYAPCIVCEEWHNFQNFGKWYDENYYEIPNEVICIDKDILTKGNKIYSPEMCVFVPQPINSLFTKDEIRRGNCVIGVTLDLNNRYRAQYNVDGEITYLGAYETEEEAYNVYKVHKEILIKQIADKYKNYIPSKLYEAMYKYEVEITD